MYDRNTSRTGFQTSRPGIVDRPDGRGVGAAAAGRNAMVKALAWAFRWRRWTRVDLARAKGVAP